MKSNVEWKKWGDIDPLYGVAAWKEKSKDGAAPWHDEEFYALGESDCRDFMRLWNQYGVKKGTCLEIGCGAGRITKHLVGFFKNIKALDISEGMISYAKGKLHNSQIEYILSEGINLPFQTNSIDAVLSTHVFQHFDNPLEAIDQFQEIYRVLNEQGSVMIHIPVYRWPSHRRFYNILYSLIKILSDFRAQYKRYKITKGKWKPLMRYTYYEIEWLYSTFDRIGFQDIEIRIICVTSTKELHPFILARKYASI